MPTRPAVPRPARALARRAATLVERRVVDPLLADLPNPSRQRLRRFVAAAAKQGSDTGFRVLDAGAGRSPYRSLFDHVTYETADFGAAYKTVPAGLDYVCDLAAIPVEDGRFDLVLCTQVMEHLPEPLAVLREFHRVLKPGGEAWLTAPLFFMEHQQPFDFHRFTQFAWRRMAEEAGFTVKELTWLEGYYATVAYQSELAARHLPARWLAWRVLLAVLARRMAKAEMRRKVMTGLPKNYRVVLVRD